MSKVQAKYALLTPSGRKYHTVTLTLDLPRNENGFTKVATLNHMVTNLVQAMHKLPIVIIWHCVLHEPQEVPGDD